MVAERILPELNTSEVSLDRESGLTLYEDMILGRFFEDKCAEMYYRGKMFGFVHIYNGQEAVSSGVIKAMRSDDYVCSTYRDHVHALSAGVPARQVMAELFGKETGCSRGRGGSMHICDLDLGMLGANGIVGGGVPIAVGAGFANKYKGNGAVSVVFFGDGASNIGAFHEAANMAAALHLPVVFVCENNEYGEYTPRDQTMAITDVVDRA
ncbi:MAG: thiamine pyrophosphate-dependent enzyme, partial [Synechocystis sp.]